MRFAAPCSRACHGRSSGTTHPRGPSRSPIGPWPSRSASISSASSPTPSTTRGRPCRTWAGRARPRRSPRRRSRSQRGVGSWRPSSRARNNLASVLFGRDLKRSLETAQSAVDLARRLGRRANASWLAGSVITCRYFLGEDWGPGRSRCPGGAGRRPEPGRRGTAPEPGRPDLGRPRRANRRGPGAHGLHRGPAVRPRPLPARPTSSVATE